VTKQDFESIKEKDTRLNGVSRGKHFIRTEKVTGTVPVVVKVSSTVIVSPLVSPRKCYETLTFLHEKGVDLGALLCCVQLGHKDQSGLIIIMEDLCEQGYQVLMPKYQMNDDEYDLSSLWSAFTELFRGILWKAAKVGCVYSDLRVGFDVTSNVLVKHNNGGILELQLIDFDSFVEAKHLPPTSDDRYLETRFSAAAYLFLQVFILGYSYEKKLRQEHVDAKNLSLEAELIFNDNSNNPFPIEAVSLLCDHYKAKFDSTFQAKKMSKGPPDSIVNWRNKNSERCSDYLKSVQPETIIAVMENIGMVSRIITSEVKTTSKSSTEEPIENFMKSNMLKSMLDNLSLKK
jgi:hypothetical protein